MNQLNTKQYYLMKWIAVLLMVTDHMAMLFYRDFNLNTEIYLTCRIIGRLAFPLFCFLLVESFYFTKNKKKHLKKIAVLAVISEIPFDIFNDNKVINVGYQNVCVTLALGFLMLSALNSKRLNNIQNKKAIVYCIKAVIVCFCGMTAFLLHTDYMWQGIILIAMFNMAKHCKYTRLIQMAALVVFALVQGNIAYAICIFDFGIILLLHNCNCNISKMSTLSLNFITNKFSKKFCAYFYPAHLIIMIAIRMVHR